MCSDSVCIIDTVASVITSGATNIHCFSSLQSSRLTRCMDLKRGQFCSELLVWLSECLELVLISTPQSLIAAESGVVLVPGSQSVLNQSYCIYMVKH